MPLCIWIGSTALEPSDKATDKVVCYPSMTVAKNLISDQCHTDLRHRLTWYAVLKCQYHIELNIRCIQHIYYICNHCAPKYSFISNQQNLSNLKHRPSVFWLVYLFRWCKHFVFILLMTVQVHYLKPSLFIWAGDKHVAYVNDMV